MTGKPAVPLGGAMPVAAPSLATCGVPVALPRRAAGGAQWAVLDTGTHHFQHGPIDLIVRVDSPESLALEAAWQRFAVILPELVAELPVLRTVQPTICTPSPPEMVRALPSTHSNVIPRKTTCETSFMVTSPGRTETMVVAFRMSDGGQK